MTALILKAILSAAIIVLVVEMAKRSPALGALVASLPLVSVLGMAWLWVETQDRQRLADHSAATFWYVVPSLPMFLLIPALLRAGVSFWLSLAAGIALTALLYFIMAQVLNRFGITL